MFCHNEPLLCFVLAILPIRSPALYHFHGSFFRYSPASFVKTLTMILRKASSTVLLGYPTRRRDYHHPLSIFLSPLPYKSTPACEVSNRPFNDIRYLAGRVPTRFRAFYAFWTEGVLAASQTRGLCHALVVLKPPTQINKRAGMHMIVVNRIEVR